MRHSLILFLMTPKYRGICSVSTEPEAAGWFKQYTVLTFTNYGWDRESGQPELIYSDMHPQATLPELAIYAPMIFTAHHVMFLMPADSLRGQVGGGWALKIETLAWNGNQRKWCHLGLKKSRFPRPNRLPHAQVMDLPAKGRINQRCIGSFNDMSSHWYQRELLGPIALGQIEGAREKSGRKGGEGKWGKMVMGGGRAVYWGCGLGTLVT
jgi:hypothetical protein